MTLRVYVRPVAFVPGPQTEHGNAVRLAGGLTYASRFAVILVDGGRVADRWIAAPDAMAQRLAELPEAVCAEAQEQWANLARARPPLALGGRSVRLDQPQVMGILNMTPDSFSDGGEWLDRPEARRGHAAAMLESGAAIVDIGGESTRPGAAATWEGEEIRRVVPAVEECAAMGAAVSIDTRRAGVMEAALRAGATLVNDVSAGRFDPRSLDLVAASGAAVVLMHAPGAGDDPHAGAAYGHVVFDVFEFLRERRDAALAAGIPMERIVLDPGIGFGKSVTENLALLNALPLFHALGCPLLVGASRKRLVGALSREAPADGRLGGSLALALRAMEAGVQLHRVHDVAESVQARDVWRGLRDAALTDFADLPG
ncbi:dihydropteroate synthase [Erythrobacteraceae bacterium CFH 75059]|uniref:dihydropteroate synthase n=1 Tax=Qipengyuania thermophila TaxID=2509361 RepID=UPI0010202F60|nr:dihydropteroate synthase [Qipengyuania thermophila]TCD02254.1 dihydropteroate synthase [Erythrobacteraceae bacterium CFH 75059]